MKKIYIFITFLLLLSVNDVNAQRRKRRFLSRVRIFKTHDVVDQNVGLSNSRANSINALNTKKSFLGRIFSPKAQHETKQSSDFHKTSFINAQETKRRNKHRGRTFKVQHEIGGNIGLSNFQGDFNGDGPADGLILVNGFTLNATHSAHLIPIRRSRHDHRFVKHLVLKSHLGITTASFDNLGVSSGNEPLTKGGDPTQVESDVLLGRITAESTVITLGTQVEYYLKDIVSYLHKNPRGRGKGRRVGFRGRRRYHRGNPYVALGIGINYVDSTPSTDPEAILTNAGGNAGLPDNFTPEVLRGIKSTVFSGTLAFGYRYKLRSNLDLVGEIKFNQYFSDRVDAVKPIVDNDNLDKNTNLTAGIIYRLF